MADTGLITYVLRDVDHGIADSVRLSAADHIADLERQIAELRAKHDRVCKECFETTTKLVAVEAENARLRVLPLQDERHLTHDEQKTFSDALRKSGTLRQVLPLKDEVERVLERAQQKMRTYVGVYPSDKELRELLSDWNALLSRLRAGEHEGWRELPLPEPTSHASISPGPVNCSIRKRCQGEAYPRTCERCSLGPCPFFHGNGEAKRLPAAPSEQGGDDNA